MTIQIVRTVALAMALLTSSANAGTIAIRYTYDQVGRVTTTLYDDGTCVVYSYDAVGNRNTQVIQNVGTGAPIWGSIPMGCFKWTPS